MIYIRGSAKSHGKKNLIEGEFKEGQKIILVEDLVNQASSMEKAVIHCREQGLEIMGAFSIVDYGTPKSLERLKSLQLVTVTKQYICLSHSCTVVVPDLSNIV